MTSNTQRALLQAQIWKIANEVRGAVDGWDFSSSSLVHYSTVLLARILRITLKEETKALIMLICLIA